MKSIFAIFAVLSFSLTAFGAIEFSEDQVSATTTSSSTPDPSAAASSASGATAPAVPPAANVMPAAPMGMINQAQSVVQRPPRTPLPANNAFMGGMMGMGGMVGGGGANGQAVAANGQPGPTTANGVPGQPMPTASQPGAGPSNPAVPEPSAMFVWSLLGLAGLVALRRRNS